MGLRVKEEGGSQGRSVTDRIGVATSPHGKPGRLPSGVDARERTANRRWAATQRCRRDCNGPCWCGCHHRGISGAGSVRVTCRWPSRPMRFTACLTVRCFMLEPDASKRRPSGSEGRGRRQRRLLTRPTYERIKSATVASCDGNCRGRVRLRWHRVCHAGQSCRGVASGGLGGQRRCVRGTY
jgi:hypothetical protein